MVFTKLQGLTLTAVGGADMPVTNIQVTLAEPCVQKDFSLTRALTIVGALIWFLWMELSRHMLCVCGKEVPLVCPLFCVK